jgi:hypothetical protein
MGMTNEGWVGPELAGHVEGMDMRRILARQMTLFASVAGESAQFAGAAK